VKNLVCQLCEQEMRCWNAFRMLQSVYSQYPRTDARNTLDL